MRKSKRTVWGLRLLCLVLLAGLCCGAMPIRAEAAGAKTPVQCVSTADGQYVTDEAIGIPINLDGTYCVFTPSRFYEGDAIVYLINLGNGYCGLEAYGALANMALFTADRSVAGDIFFSLGRAEAGKSYTLLGITENDAVLRDITISKIGRERNGVYPVTVNENISDIIDLAAVVDRNGNLVAIADAGGVYALIGEPSSGGNMVLYIGIGVAAAAILLFLLKKRNSPSNQSTTDTISGQSVQKNISGVPDRPADSNASQLPRPPRPPRVEGVQLSLDVVSGPMAGHSYPIPEIPLLVGRANEANIRYPADTKGVSRNHCRIFWKNSVLYIMDLGSTSGTFLRGRGKLQPSTPVPLKAQDTIYLGSKQVALQLKARS